MLAPAGVGVRSTRPRHMYVYLKVHGLGLNIRVEASEVNIRAFQASDL